MGKLTYLRSVRLWVRGLIAAIITGVSGGVLTAFGTMGIDAEHFNRQDPELLFTVLKVAVIANAIIGLAAFLKQSPLPNFPDDDEDTTPKPQ